MTIATPLPSSIAPVARSHESRCAPTRTISSGRCDPRISAMTFADGASIDALRRIVEVETKGYKQDGTVVCIFRRKVMVPTKEYIDARGGEQPGRPQMQPRD